VKRSAILEAATRIIVMQGLSAPTAGIAKEAGVANGSLFTYFETKTDLFNHLYLEIKAEIASAILKNRPASAEPREEFFHIWRAAGHKTMEPVAELLERARAIGAMQKAPKGFVAALMNSIAEATMDFMTQDPANAKKYSKEGFDALWRMLS
jgi:AcrR family transcriptional regulator